MISFSMQVISTFRLRISQRSSPAPTNSQKSLSLFLLAAEAASKKREELGHSPKPQVKDSPPLTVPLLKRLEQRDGQTFFMCALSHAILPWDGDQPLWPAGEHQG